MRPQDIESKLDVSRITLECRIRHPDPVVRAVAWEQLRALKNFGVEKGQPAERPK